MIAHLRQFRVVPFFVLSCGLLSSLNASPSLLDFDGDGMSDIWQLAYDASDLLPNDDDDDDGLSNLEESKQGSDPKNADSRFEFLALDATDDGLVFRFRGIAGQSYYFEVSSDLETWQMGSDIVTSNGGISELVSPHRGEDKRFMRMQVGLDRDGDGVSDLEETLLGLDPMSANSSNDPSVNDGVYVANLLSNDASFSVNGQDVSGRLPTAEQASRFLHQATLGATMEEIESVMNLGYEGWIESQFQEAAGKINPGVEWWYENEEPPIFSLHRRYAWWEQVMNSNDLLRQRMAVALSEIYVISDQSLDGKAATTGMATYYDMLLDNSFGNWRTLLSDVSKHPAMGFYLSHLQNRKADPEANRFPDENYAREIMQLFSIGLFELNPDGTRIKDENGFDIPTYDNGDITNFARVFTGFSFGPPEANPDNPIHFVAVRWTWDLPMKMWLSQHDTEEKTLLNGLVLPAYENDPGRTALDDFDAAIDNLFNHQNVGPFIGYRLIQRLVTSNPSPAYVARVSQAFADNGSGVRGDMKAVIRAILLDPEARSAFALNDPHAGRLREPYLRWVRLVKTLQASSPDGTYLIPDWGVQNSIAQRVLSSPSVFNFFLPDYVETGEMADAGLVGPEFQILTATTAMATQNVYGGALMWGFGLWDNSLKDKQLSFSFTEEIDMLRNDGVDAVIERLDLLLTYGQLREDTKEILRDAYDNRAGWFNDRHTISMLVRIVVLSPEFAIAR